MYSRLKHGFQIAESDFFVDRGSKETQAPCSLGNDLAPTLSECSFDRENDGIWRIPVEIFDRRKYEVWLTIDVRLSERSGSTLHVHFMRSVKREP
jgi:hypothetical protein